MVYLPLWNLQNERVIELFSFQACDDSVPQNMDTQEDF